MGGLKIGWAFKVRCYSAAKTTPPHAPEAHIYITCQFTELKISKFAKFEKKVFYALCGCEPFCIDDDGITE